MDDERPPPPDPPPDDDPALHIPSTTACTSVTGDNQPSSSVVSPTSTTATVTSCASTTSTYVTLEPYTRLPQHNNASRKKYQPVSNLSSLFDDSTWTKHFNIPPSAPVRDDVNFSTQLLQQVGKNVVFHSRQDGSRTVTVQSHAQAVAMSTLCTADGRPIESRRDTVLNSRTGTVLIPFSIKLLESQPFEESSESIKENLEAQDLPIVSVACYTIPPRGRRTQTARVARICFDSRSLPDNVIIGGRRLTVKPFVNRPRQCNSCWKFGHPNRYCRSTPVCPKCAASDHTKDACTATTFLCSNCGEAHPAFSDKCRFYAFHSRVRHLQTEEGYTLREAREQARRQGFSATTTYARRLRSTPTSSSSVLPSIPPPPVLTHPPTPHPAPVPTSSPIPLSNPFTILDNVSSVDDVSSIPPPPDPSVQSPQPKRKRRSTQKSVDHSLTTTSELPAGPSHHPPLDSLITHTQHQISTEKHCQDSSTQAIVNQDLSDPMEITPVNLLTGTGIEASPHPHSSSAALPPAVSETAGQPPRTAQPTDSHAAPPAASEASSTPARNSPLLDAHTTHVNSEYAAHARSDCLTDLLPYPQDLPHSLPPPYLPSPDASLFDSQLSSHDSSLLHS